MQKSAIIKITMTTGLALFAMFFGAGNIIFPLQLGSTSGQYTSYALLAFIISGVGAPFLGLFAVSLYEGDYWKFFQRLGKIPAFILVTFLILIIGPLFAAPRTEVVTYHTLLPALPAIIKNIYVFNFIYFLIVFAAVARQSKVVDIIGWLLSPVKVIAFSILIVLAVSTAHPLMNVHTSAYQIFNNSLVTGYGTMDLLGAVFFCAVAYKHILCKCQKIGEVSQQTMRKMILIACLIGALLIAVIYAGLFIAAATHAQALQNIPTEALIGKISYVIMGPLGLIFVGVCVSFACLATAIALAEVATDYFYNHVFMTKVPRIACIIAVLSVMYLMAILGFAGIMKIAGPILNVVYPVLILMCVVNIALKLKHKKSAVVKKAAFITAE